MGHRVQSQRLTPASEEERGRRTWEWWLPNGRQVTIYQRFPGESFAEHFHTGRDLAKNPERFLLLSGAIEFRFEAPGQEMITEVFDAAGGPVEILISAGVMHSALTRQGCLFIEYRGTRFDPERPDTYGREHFPKGPPSS